MFVPISSFHIRYEAKKIKRINNLTSCCVLEIPSTTQSYRIIRPHRTSLNFRSKKSNQLHNQSRHVQEASGWAAEHQGPEIFASSLAVTVVVSIDWRTLDVDKVRIVEIVVEGSSARPDASGSLSPSYGRELIAS